VQDLQKKISEWGQQEKEITLNQLERKIRTTRKKGKVQGDCHQTGSDGGALLKKGFQVTGRIRKSDSSSGKKARRSRLQFSRETPRSRRNLEGGTERLDNCNPQLRGGKGS